MPGENITVRLKQTDGDVANYLTLQGKGASEVIVEALRFKIKAETVNKGMAIKPEQLPLLNEIEKLIDEKCQQYEQRLVRLLSQVLENSSSFRDNELSAGIGLSEVENSKDEISDDNEENEAAAAMMDFGAF
ncbi:hypothetical protein D3C74_91800 [compost metagenome]